MATTMTGAMQWNMKTIAVLTGALTLVVYAVYSMRSGSSDQLRSKSTLKVFDSWKTKDFVEIPDTIKEKMTAVKINEHHLNLRITEKVNVDVRFQEYYPRSGTHDSVLLLHGAGSSSDVWKSTKTINLLAAMDFRVVALDLPGYGKTQSKVKLSTSEERAEFLRAFIEQENLGRPVIVSPSVSGSFSIPFIMGKKPISCTDRVRGFIPVAPVGTDAYSFAQYHKCETPTMIVYGSKDKSLGLTSLNNLRNLGNNEMFPMEKAGHPSYMDKPDEWRFLLYNYMLALERFKE